MNRRYDLDWLRVMAFGILMLFHTGMAFSSYDWHVKNYESSPLIDELIHFLHQWRMPLLFFISGAAVWFAMEKYSTWRYLRERQTRLLIPLIFGLLVVIPPQVYCERVYQRQGYASFLDFYPTIFTSGTYPQGNMSWHHLWYIPYIWAFSMVTMPLFLWLRTNGGRAVLAKLQNLLTSPALLFALFLPSAGIEILLRPFFPGDSCDLISDWANFTHKLSFFVVGFILASAGNVSDTLALHRRKFLGSALISLLLLEGVWTSRIPLGSPAAYRCLSNFHTWMWILTALGFARKHLSFNHPFLRYATDAVYPFYILHQTVIVLLVLPLVYLDWGLWTKYFAVLAGMSLVTWGLFDRIISRVSVLRICFGMKPKRATARSSAQAPTQQPVTASLVPNERNVAPDLNPAVLTGGGFAKRQAFIDPATPEAVRAVTSGTVPNSLFLLLIMAVGSQSALADEGQIVPVIIKAPSLSGNLMGISDSQPAAVYLPARYSLKNKRYPVIYFLPNFSTPVWRYTAGNYQGFRLRQTADQLIRGGIMPETIIVIPNTIHFMGGSWYRNSPLTGNWEDFITRDLIGFIDGHFRAIARPGARGIAGHAVGGTGALELALKHPDLFGSVYAMSPAVLIRETAREFTASGDVQDPAWRAFTARLSHLDEAVARASFRLYMQRCLYSPSSVTRFDGLRLSCAAATPSSRQAAFPYISFPSPDSMDKAGRDAFWEEIMGNWEVKIRDYLARPERLNRITLEYGREEEHEFIRRGTPRVSDLMRTLGVTNTLVVSEGRHDSTLGRRLKDGMLPALANALTSD